METVHSDMITDAKLGATPDPAVEDAPAEVAPDLRTKAHELIGSRLREARLRSGLGVRELSRQLEISASSISQIELGRVVPSGPGLAWETLLVNVVGSFLLAAGAVLILERLGPTRLLWPLFATGFCGSFTTFSTFAVEVDLHLRSGDVAPGLGYGVVSVALGLAAVTGGAALARSVLRRKAVPENRTDPPRRRSWS